MNIKDLVNIDSHISINYDPILKRVRIVTEYGGQVYIVGHEYKSLRECREGLEELGLYDRASLMITSIGGGEIH